MPVSLPVRGHHQLHAQSTHIWNIEIRYEQARLVCVSRLTLAVLDRR